MYQPAHHREDRLDVQHALIAAHPFGLLISSGAGGLLANGVPFTLDKSGSPKGTLRVHVARANPQAREFMGEGRDCLVVFQGPQAYVTPSWYATKRETGKVVPTWNYVMVQVRGHGRAHDGAPWLRAQLEQLTQEREAARSERWNVSDAPEDFTAVMMRGIVGIEIPIDGIEGKWKVSQNRPEADRRGVHAGLVAGGEAQAAMADIVAERGGLSKGQ